MKKNPHPGTSLRAVPRARLGRRTVIANLIGTVGGFVLPLAAHAQYCSTQNGTYTCSLPATSSGTSLGVSETGGGNNGAALPMTVTAPGGISYAAPSTINAALQVSAYGQGGNIGGDAQGLTLTSSGPITVTQGQSSIGDYVFGIWARQLAGSSNSGTGGSTTAQVVINNSSPISLNLSGVATTGGAGIWATDQGGTGTSGYAGGSSTGITINNASGGTINATVSGADGFGGIQAFSYGGNGVSGNAGGGAGGPATLSNAAAVNVDYTWQNAGTTNYGVWGVQAFSAGGTGNSSTSSSGGAGGAGGPATINLSSGANVTLSVQGTGPSTASNPASAAVGAASNGGNGGYATQGNNNSGAAGGAAGQAQISVTDASVTASGANLPALLATSMGGTGGYGGTPSSQVGSQNPSQNGGAGGSAAGAAITVTAQTTSITISTASDGAGLAPAIGAIAQGGAGAYGGYSQDSGFSTSHGGTGGAGGDAGAVGVQVQGNNGNTVTLSTNGNLSPGIYAASLGGAGGYGGGAMTSISGHADGGTGGAGGAGSDINVSVGATTINTSQNESPGIVVRSEGGVGASGGYANAGTGSAHGGDGGNGGASGNLTITTDAASAITTQGADSTGILAQTLSAAGGDANGNNAIGGGSAGNAGVGGQAGNVTLNNAAAITTAGLTARGILVQSMAGPGGTGGSSWSIASSSGGTGGVGGAAGQLTITNSGAISTSQQNSEGVLMQSIGGSGGAGGQASGVIANVGGGGGAAANGGTLLFTNSGAITTGGMGSIGVLGQSIGGSGGDGGGASGITVTVGGTGGNAAAGGTINATLNSGSNITTAGAGAHGVVFQSIGGGGGNGGDATSTGTFVTVAVGGSGGDGGAGGAVTVNTSGANISAAGNKSTGLIAQSIGGGGGTGGSAMGTSIGAVFDTSVSVGGSGGNAASNAGQVSVNMVGGSIDTGQDPHLIQGSTAPGSCLGSSAPAASACNVLPVDSHGVVVQSIGGGGGHGGQATAQAIAVGVPVTPEGSQLAVSAAVAVGGNGGSGGNGGTAQFSLSNGGTVTTSGNGGVGALIQSVGGGGGDGGDSSAMAATIGYGSNSVPEGGKAPGITLTSTVAGNGGSAGSGANVQVAVGGTVSADGKTFTCDCNGTSTSIQTYGDYAAGILAQSIGGGGGNAGQGGGNTQSFGTGSSSSLTFNVGRRGSPGGNGGGVTVNLYPGNGIQTWGSAAVGIIAQSIGGGGGTSQGGSFGLQQSFSPSTGPTQKPGMNVNLGNQASEKGGVGQSVTVLVQAPIVTHGNDATGVLAQSIGGGGGLGGSSGSDGSGDNPVLRALEGREFVSNVVNYLNEEGWSPQQNTTMNVSVGGTGGSGGGAGPVSVTLGAQISTLGNPVTAGGNQQASSGDWAHGIVAQSIGGGGGKGGSATSSGSGADPAEHNVFYDFAVGGSGGSGGSGDQVNVNFSNGAAIQTVGYGATGIVAQSIGGGGGMGADGSDSAGGNLSLGGGAGGNGGSGGLGAIVDFENTSSNGSISTAGTFADGMNLQSIGGGGGIAGAGASVWGALGTPHVSASMSFTAGGGSAASGAGGNVYVNQNFTNNAPLAINVSGYGAYGIVAQSIGGGGGNIIANQAGSGDPSVKIGGLSGDSGATGGSVLVQLTTPTTINANGTAGIGVVAQSVGNGGGIIRINDGSNTTPSLTTSYNPAFVNRSSPGPANGGSVQVTSYATINANGPGGIGIFAQSVGGGGGLILNGSTLYAGAPLQQQRNCTTSSCGGIPASGANNFEVSIQGGSVSATGTNGIGIFAQAAGYGTPGGGTPDVVVGNGWGTVTVTGGTGSGAAGIWVDRPNGNSSNNDSWVTINSYGVVTNATSQATNGTAIKVTGGGIIALANYGSITGALDLNTDQGIVGNGTWNPGALTPRGALQNDRGSLLNYGTWAPGNRANADILNLGMIAFDSPALTTQVNGHFIQRASGTLSPMIDSLNGRTSLLAISGSASVDGTIAPNAITLLPGTVPVLTAGSLDTTAQAKDSLIFDWDARRADNTITLTPAHADFTPSGVGMSSSQSSLANYYSRAWNNADPTIATVFGGLSHIYDGGTYKDTLDQFSSKGTQAQSIALANSAGTILGSSMSCPVFEGKGVMLTEDNCVWGQVNGRWSDQSTSGDTQGYHVSGTTYRVGGQHRIAPNWYLGASVAAGQTWARAKNGSNGDGDTYDGSITLKHVAGPWYFAGSLAMASGSFDANRHVNAFGTTETVTSKPSIFLAGTRLRAGYEFAYDSWYVRPYGDLDFIYTHMPGFKEKGAPGYALDVRTNDGFNVAVSPMVEVGRRYEMDAKTTLRAYAALGFTWRPDSTYTLSSSFVGADSSNGTFTDYVKTPEVLAKVDLGVQLFRAGGFEFRAGYTADFSRSFSSQTASARFAYHF